MPRKKGKNRHKYMPWTFKHGAWYYPVPAKVKHEWDNKSWFRLGKTEQEAYETWYARLGQASPDEISTMAEVFDVYEAREVPKLAPRTQENYGYYLKPLRRFFGRMHPASVQPMHAYQYQTRREHKPNAANSEISVLTKAMTTAVKLGIIPRNPLKGQVERIPVKGRDRSPTRAELEAFLNAGPKSLDVKGKPLRDASPTLRAYVALKRITGVRQGQLLAVDLDRVFEDGTKQWDGKKLTIPKAKDGRDVVYKGWDLEVVMEYIIHLRGPTRLPVGPLFLTNTGDRWGTSALKNQWKRQMAKYEAEGGVRFNEHDIRAYVADEAESDEQACDLLGHSDIKTTRQIYVRKRKVEVEVLELEQ